LKTNRSCELAGGLDDAIDAIARLSRRDFVRFSAASLVVTGAAGTHAAMPAGLKFMSESEAAVFAKLADVVLPVAGSKLVDLGHETILKTIDAALLGTMAPHVLAGLKGGIQYFDQGPVETYQKRFVQLSDEEATRFCDAWGNGALPPQRGLAMGLKKLVQLGYWANPPTWAPLEYEGPLSRKRGLASLGNAPLPTR
jgi:hypothetical protein